MTRGDLPLNERLDRIEDKQDQQLQMLVTVQLELAALKTKASFWGASAGLVAGALITKLLGG
jgi:hypothetical protein